MSLLKKYIYSGQIFIFLFFVLAASVGWLVNKLSADYLRTINIPIEMYNSSDLRQIFSIETEITVQVRMSGFAAASQYKSPSVSPIRIDISRKNWNKRIVGKSYILSSEIFPSIADILGNGKKLVSISPDTIFFKFSQSKSKLVPINSNMSITFAPEYMQYKKIELTPDSIWVSANKDILAKITEIKCEPRKFENVSESFSGVLYIEENKSKDISYQQKQVAFKVNVERYSESIVKVPVELINYPDSLNVMLFPAEVEVKYRAAIKDFAEMNAGKFRVVADFNELANALKGNVKLIMDKVPDEVLQSQITPGFVEVIVSKKNK